MDEELLNRIEPYKAPYGAARKYISPPCQLCGWCPSETIHTNPQLIGNGPYHVFEPTKGD